MPTELSTSPKFVTSIATSREEILKCIAFRSKQFRPERALSVPYCDEDKWDWRETCFHLYVQYGDEESGYVVVGYLRMFLHHGGEQLHKSYTARYFNMRKWLRLTANMLEFGRLALEPGQPMAGAILLEEMARFAMRNDVALWFGVTSFGEELTDDELEALEQVLEGQSLPEELDLEAARGRVNCLVRRLGKPKLTIQQALRRLPSTMGLYHRAGARVSRRVVRDSDLRTNVALTMVNISEASASFKARLARL